MGEGVSGRAHTRTGGLRFNSAFVDGLRVLGMVSMRAANGKPQPEMEIPYAVKRKNLSELNLSFQKKIELFIYYSASIRLYLGGGSVARSLCVQRATRIQAR
jgi:hypothetical protein